MTRLPGETGEGEELRSVSCRSDPSMRESPGPAHHGGERSRRRWSVVALPPPPRSFAGAQDDEAGGRRAESVAASLPEGGGQTGSHAAGYSAKDRGLLARSQS